MDIVIGSTTGSIKPDGRIQVDSGNELFTHTWSEGASIPTVYEGPLLAGGSLTGAMLGGEGTVLDDELPVFMD